MSPHTSNGAVLITVMYVLMTQTIAKYDEIL